MNAEPQFLFHPLENNATVSLSKEAFETFLASIDHCAEWTSLTDRAVA
ncbi:hypothetical protein [Paraburkholderia fynbosensis]|nr:hypothetical protein [Paraburkholderia fynbosensis]